MKGKDRLFENSITEPGDFVFDNRVVSVFPDMINRSVPGYGTIVPMIGMMARRYAQPDTSIYDLGCSLGAATLAVQKAVRSPGVVITAVDNSPGMVEGLRATLDRQEGGDVPPVRVFEQDVMDTEISNASFVILNFTLQFIAPDKRLGLIERIAAGLRPGGVLLLSEKMRFEDPREQQLQTDWHHDFKRAQGYSELEIARKRDALERVMIPETPEIHAERLRQAGFERSYRWFQGFNFQSLVAFR